MSPIFCGVIIFPAGRETGTNPMKRQHIFRLSMIIFVRSRHARTNLYLGLDAHNRDCILASIDAPRNQIVRGMHLFVVLVKPNYCFIERETKFSMLLSFLCLKSSERDLYNLDDDCFFLSLLTCSLQTHIHSRMEKTIEAGAA